MVITYENFACRPSCIRGRACANCGPATGPVPWVDEKHMLPYGVASGEELAAGVGAGARPRPATSRQCCWGAMDVPGRRGRRLGRPHGAAFFNAGAAPVSQDFPARRTTRHRRPAAATASGIDRSRPGRHRLRAAGLCRRPLVPCCIGACNRILPCFIANMWMATADGGLAATLYGPCTVSTLVGNHRVR